MQSIDDKIVISLSKGGRGVAFSAARFAHYGNADALRKAIARLCDKKTVIRLARGIYYYPKIERKLGLGIIYPTFDEIAAAIATRDRAKIAPIGTYAVNKLGLSTQIPMNAVFMTTGKVRAVVVENGRKIVFKRVSQKNFVFESSFAQLVCIALKEIGKDNLTQQQTDTLKQIINEQPRISEMDLKIMPEWIKKLIKGFYNE